MNADIAAEMIQPELREDEQVLWSGQPDPAVLFVRGDVFMIPFSLIWAGLAIFWEYLALVTPFDDGSGGGVPIFIPMFGAVFIVIGLYMVFGRFVFKVQQKKNTYYAVTDRRIIVLTDFFGRKLRAAQINSIPVVAKSSGRSGAGTLIFGVPPSPFLAMYENSGLDFFAAWYGGLSIAFHDIRDVDAVHRLVDERINQ